MSSSSSSESESECFISYKDCNNTHKKTRKEMDEIAKKCGIKNPTKLKPRSTLCKTLVEKYAEKGMPKRDDNPKEKPPLPKKDLGDYKLVELRQLAKEEGLTGYSKYNKADLIEFIEEQRNKGKKKKKKNKTPPPSSGSSNKSPPPSPRRKTPPPSPRRKTPPPSPKRKSDQKEISEEELILKTLHSLGTYNELESLGYTLKIIRQKIKEKLDEKGYDIDVGKYKEFIKAEVKKMMNQDEDEEEEEEEAVPPSPKKRKKTKVKNCKKDEVLNPKSNRCVKRSGTVGKKILAEQQKGNESEEEDEEDEEEEDEEEARKQAEKERHAKNRKEEEARKQAEKERQARERREEEEARKQAEDISKKGKKKKVHIIDSENEEINEDDIVKRMVKIINKLINDKNQVKSSDIKNKLKENGIELDKTTFKKLREKALEVIENEEDEDDDEENEKAIERRLEEQRRIREQKRLEKENRLRMEEENRLRMEKEKEQNIAPPIPPRPKQNIVPPPIPPRPRPKQNIVPPPIPPRPKQNIAPPPIPPRPNQNIVRPPPIVIPTMNEEEVIPPFSFDIKEPEGEKAFESSYKDKDIESILSEIQYPTECNPFEDKYCDDDMVCDARKIPGTCISQEKADNLNLEEIIINGFKIVGTKESIETLNKDYESRNLNVNKEGDSIIVEEDVYEKLSNTYKIGDRVLYKDDQYARIEKVDNILDRLLISFPTEIDEEDIWVEREEVSLPLGQDKIIGSEEERNIKLNKQTPVFEEPIYDDEEKQVEEEINEEEIIIQTLHSLGTYKDFLRLEYSIKDIRQKIKEKLEQKGYNIDLSKYKDVIKTELNKMEQEESESDEEEVNVEEEENQPLSENEESDEEETEGKIKVNNIDDFLNDIEDIKDDDLDNVDIVNNQVLKCLGLMS